MKIKKMPMPLPSECARQELVEQIGVARTYTYPVWSEEKKELGTSVMLRAGNQLFALTANHCVPQGKGLNLHPNNRQNSFLQTLKTITRDPFDLAILELENRHDVLASNLEQVCIDLPNPPTKDSNPDEVPIFWVVGYPSRLAKLIGNDILTVERIPFGTNIIAVGPDEFSLYYHEEAYDLGKNIPHETSPMPETPHGFSGSGVWYFAHPEDGILLNPLKHVRLYGIQFAWLNRSRLLKCVPSRIIVELLLENYPDLKDQLNNLFPALPHEPARLTV